jgi:hypothetical protein
LRGSRAPGPCGGQDGLDDPLVAGAPAQVRGDQLADLRLGRAAVAGRGGRARVGQLRVGEVCLSQHQETGRAESALQPVMIAERLLQVRKLVAVGQSFDGADLAAVRLHAEHQARAGRAAVDQHGARAADTVLAAQVGACVAEVVPEHVGERPP